MTSAPNRKLSDAQIRIVRAKRAKAGQAPVAANDAAPVETRKILPVEAVRIQLDLSSADIVRDLTQRGIDRVVVEGDNVRIVAFGEIAAMIDRRKRIDGYCTVRNGVTKIIGYENDGFVFDERGDDWAAPTAANDVGPTFVAHVRAPSIDIDALCDLENDEDRVAVEDWFQRNDAANYVVNDDGSEVWTNRVLNEGDVPSKPIHIDAELARIRDRLNDQAGWCGEAEPFELRDAGDRYVAVGCMHSCVWCYSDGTGYPEDAVGETITRGLPVTPFGGPALVRDAGAGGGFPAAGPVERPDPAR